MLFRGRTSHEIPEIPQKSGVCRISGSRIWKFRARKKTNSIYPQPFHTPSPSNDLVTTCEIVRLKSCLGRIVCAQIVLFWDKERTLLVHLLSPVRCLAWRETEAATCRMRDWMEQSQQEPAGFSQAMLERTGRNTPIEFQPFLALFHFRSGLPNPPPCSGPDSQSLKNVQDGPKIVSKFFRARRQSKKTPIREPENPFWRVSEIYTPKNANLRVHPEGRVFAGDVASKCMSALDCQW